MDTCSQLSVLCSSTLLDHVFLGLAYPPPCAGYVVFYLMRSNPQLMLRLQNGRFDAPDRLFWCATPCL